MDTTRITHRPRTAKDPATRLQRLEEKLRHELLSEEERCELADQVARLRRKLGL